MDLYSSNRRRFLLSSCSVGAATLAGCLGGGDSADDGPGDGTIPTVELGSYTNLLAPAENDETFFTYLDVVEEQPEAAIDPRNTDDPMITTPFGAINQLISVSAVLEFAGLSGLVDSQRVDQYETTIDAQVIANGPFALVGDIDRMEIQSVLESEDSEGRALTFEQEDTVGGHLIFVGSSDEVTQRVAVSSASIIIAEQRGDIDRVVGAVTGDRTRTDEEYGAFEWLLPDDEGYIVTGGYGPAEEDGGSVPQPGTLEGIHGLVSSLDFREASISATVSAVFGDDLDETTRAEVEAAFGGDAADPTYDYGSDRVTITGTYDESTLS